MTIWRDWTGINSVTGKPRPGATHSWWHYCERCTKLTGPVAGQAQPLAERTTGQLPLLQAAQHRKVTKAVQQPRAIAALMIKIEHPRQRVSISGRTPRHGPLLFGVVRKTRITQLPTLHEGQPQHQIHASTRPQALQRL